MNSLTLLFLLGFLQGVLFSLFIVLIVAFFHFFKARDKVERVITKMLSKKAVIINPSNPLDDIEI